MTRTSDKPGWRLWSASLASGSRQRLSDQVARWSSPLPVGVVVSSSPTCSVWHGGRSWYPGLSPEWRRGSRPAAGCRATRWPELRGHHVVQRITNGRGFLIEDTGGRASRLFEHPVALRRVQVRRGADSRRASGMARRAVAGHGSGSCFTATCSTATNSRRDVVRGASWDLFVRTSISIACPSHVALA